MTFGYIGYIWALLGCACFGVIFGGSAVFLYGVARRGRDTEGEKKITVEQLGKDDKGPPDAA